jgi:integrase
VSRGSSIRAALATSDRAVRWAAVAKLGRIRERTRAKSSRIEFYLDFRPYGRVWANRGVPLTDRDGARRLLEFIRGEIAECGDPEGVLARYQSAKAKANLVPTRLERWLEVRKHHASEGETLSPTTIAEYIRYSKPEGHFTFFEDVSIHEITYGMLEDFDIWLASRNLGPKTRRNVLSAFLTFLKWLRQRGEIREVPAYRLPRPPEHEPQLLGPAEQWRVLQTMPENERGIFLAMALMGLRPGEARALDVADVHDGWLTVDRAVKGKGASSPIRGTKTGKPKTLPMPEDVSAWIERNVATAGRLVRAPLFPNPSTGNRWNHQALNRAWNRAVAAAGLPAVPLYEGTKHSFATEAIRRRRLGSTSPAISRPRRHPLDAPLRSTRRTQRSSGCCRRRATWRQAGDKVRVSKHLRSRAVRRGPPGTRTRNQRVKSPLLCR